MSVSLVAAVYQWNQNNPNSRLNVGNYRTCKTSGVGTRIFASYNATTKTWSVQDFSGCCGAIKRLLRRCGIAYRGTRLDAAMKAHVKQILGGAISPFALDWDQQNRLSTLLEGARTLTSADIINSIEALASGPFDPTKPTPHLRAGFELLRRDQDIFNVLFDKVATSLLTHPLAEIHRDVQECIKLHNRHSTRDSTCLLFAAVLNKDPMRFYQPDNIAVLRFSKAQMLFQGANGPTAYHFALQQGYEDVSAAILEAYSIEKELDAICSSFNCRWQWASDQLDVQILKGRHSAGTLICPLMK